MKTHTQGFAQEGLCICSLQMKFWTSSYILWNRETLCILILITRVLQLLHVLFPLIFLICFAPSLYYSSVCLTYLPTNLICIFIHQTFSDVISNWSLDGANTCEKSAYLPFSHIFLKQVFSGLSLQVTISVVSNSYQLHQ